MVLIGFVLENRFVADCDGGGGCGVGAGATGLISTETIIGA
jgi:hypothetical protein